jgi:glyoxylase-like metal-dependent hydrolase (beta-lactamase superfamily II)
MRYQWIVLQDGSLPLRPNRRVTAVPHLCTATLVWPADEKPSAANSVVADPSFSDSGWQTAQQRLRDLGAGEDCLGYFFETHRHYDHLLQLPVPEMRRMVDDAGTMSGRGWRPREMEDQHPLPGVAVIPCTGHAPDLRALRFDTGTGQTWVVGDAILDRDWLAAWGYYWPNGYGVEAIVQTWHSVAQILETADVVIPGHGAPILVDAELLRVLVSGFPRAAYANQCPEVADRLTRRLRQLE